METKIEKGYPSIEPVMSRINWGAIVGGTIIGIFFQTLLGLLGLAIGITAFKPGQPITTAMSIGAGVYITAITILSVYIGAFAAGRFTGLVSRYDALLHGVATLALLTVISLLTISTGMGTIVGGSLAYGLQANKPPQVQVQQVSSTLGVTNKQQTTGAAAPLNAQERAYLQQQADKLATGASWTAFVTAFLSLIVAAIGGIMGMKSRVTNHPERSIA